MIAKRKRTGGTVAAAPRQFIRRSPLRRFTSAPRTKFGNRVVHIAGESFASGLESRVTASLRLLERAGQIRNLQREVTHQLYVGQGDSCCACQLAAPGLALFQNAVRIYAPRMDFQFEELTPRTHGEHAEQWKLIYADAKGFQDDKQRMGYKLFAAIHGQAIRLYRKGDLS